MYFLPLVERLSESGTTALGPAALLAIAMASRQPGSKVCLVSITDINLSLRLMLYFTWKKTSTDDHLHMWSHNII